MESEQDTLDQIDEAYGRGYAHALAHVSIFGLEQCINQSDTVKNAYEIVYKKYAHAKNVFNPEQDE